MRKLLILTIFSVAVAVYVGTLLNGGPLAPFQCTLLSTVLADSFCPKPFIQGSATKEFKLVQQVYEHNFEEYLEAGSQIAVFHKGKRVVDLWGTNPSSSSSYSNSTLQRVFSSGKMVESMVAIMCVDRGLFKWTDTIAQHWAEFAQHGKDGITITDLMRHEAGLHVFSTQVTVPVLEEYTRGNAEPLSRIIEQSVPEWLNDTRRVYHAVTRGWILAELVRRVDPQHRLMHQFVHEEIATPLGIDLFVSVSKNQMHRVLPQIAVPIPWALVHLVLPFLLGDTVPFIPQLDEEVRTMMMSGTDSPLQRGTKSWANGNLDLTNPMSWNHLYNISFSASAGMLGTGSALAVIATVFAERGVYTPSGARLFSEAATHEAYKCSEAILDAALGMATRMSTAGFGCGVHGENWYGWGGWGGSIVAWKEPERVAMGYAMTRMGFHLLKDPRLLRFTGAIEASLQN